MRTPLRARRRAKTIAPITRRAFARLAANDNGVTWQQLADERRVARWLREYDEQRHSS